MVEWAGSAARAGGHVPFRSQPRGQPKQSPNLGEGTGKPWGLSRGAPLPRRPGGGSRWPHPAQEAPEDAGQRR